MEELSEKIKKLIEFLGYRNVDVSYNQTDKRVSILISDLRDDHSDLQRILFPLERLIGLMAKKAGAEPAMVDINNYRVERERLIVELAKAAAHKVLINKAAVELPPMNAYERRLVHVEIAARPDLKTESVGEGPTRRVVVRPIEV